MLCEAQNHAAIQQALRQGDELLRQNRADAALEKFRAAVKLGDPSGAGQYGEGLVWLARKQYGKALPFLRAAVAANRADTARLFTLAATELELKQVAAARKHIDMLTQLEPNNAWLRFRLGTLLREQGHPEHAERQFRAAAGALQTNPPSAQQPRLSDVLLQLGQLRFARFDYAGGVNELSRIDLELLDPAAQAAVLDLQGYGLLSLGRIAEARDKLRMAVKQDGSQPDSIVRLIWTELLSGAAREARTLAAAARTQWPQHTEVQQAFALAERENTPARASIPFTGDWALKGEGIVCCPCRVPCPCRSNARPSFGRCENAGVFRIEKGNYGKVSLDGLAFVTAGCSMGPHTLPSVLYADRSAADAQLIALERLYQTFVPGRPVLFSALRRAPISLLRWAKDQTYEAEIPGVLEIKIRRRPVLPSAALDYFANVIEYADNLVYRIHDNETGLNWDYSGRQSNYRRFDLSARDYEEGRMLIQYADGSGSLNRKQRELVQQLKLPPPGKKRP
jgi:Flp pilus assembly protein TadD